MLNFLVLYMFSNQGLHQFCPESLPCLPWLTMTIQLCSTQALVLFGFNRHSHAILMPFGTANKYYTISLCEHGLMWHLGINSMRSAGWKAEIA